MTLSKTRLETKEGNNIKSECPECGNNMDYNEKGYKYYCRYCGYVLEV